MGENKDCEVEASVLCLRQLKREVVFLETLHCTDWNSLKIV